MDNEMENITSDINFSEEQIEQLYAGFVKRFRLEEQARDEQREGANLPQEIFEEMEYSSKNGLAFNLKKVARDVRKYEEGDGPPLKPSIKALFPTSKDATLTLSKLLRPNIRMQIDSDSQVMESLKSMKPSKWQPE